MRKLIAVGATAATTLTLALAVSAPAQGDTSSRQPHASTAKSYSPPPIKWGPCSNSTLKSYGAQCGYLVVPMDYDHPKRTKIKLAVSRVLHTTSDKKYQGVMLVNPGGPGGSGLIYSIFQTFVPQKGGAAYDWIGFDPRGVGSSKPALSCNANFFHGDRPPYNPHGSKKIMKQWVSRSKQYAAACAKTKHSALFKHVKTIDSVKDMESLRKALGRRQINFYGFSYGTYLGSVYATLHPNRVRRFVLDSTVDPRNVFYKDNLKQDVAFQKTFNIYFSWLAKYHSVYHLGSTRAAVRHVYLQTIRRLDQHAAKGVLGGDELIDVVTSAAYYVYGWEDIGAALSSYINDGNPDPLIQMYKDANPTTPGGDNSYAMYLGTQCTDAAWPQSQDRLNKDSRRLNKHHDYLTWSNAWFNGPCAYWHYKPDVPVHVTGKKVHAPILMIDETFDPATPYAGSLYVRKIFPTASLIEGRNGTTHAGSLSGVACTDNAIARYLKFGAVPPRKRGNRSDKVCQPVPKPDPTAPSATARTAGPNTSLGQLRVGELAAATRH